jgi:hypothetical protein
VIGNQSSGSKDRTAREEIREYSRKESSQCECGGENAGDNHKGIPACLSVDLHCFGYQFADFRFEFTGFHGFGAHSQGATVRNVFSRFQQAGHFGPFGVIVGVRVA